MARKPDVDLDALRALVGRVYGDRWVEITRTDSGTTTQVYRLRSGQTVHYLRVAEEPDDRSGAERSVHHALLAAGVRVPEVVHYEPFDPALNRSVLITGEIAGKPLTEVSDNELRADALRAAGRDLAVINRLTVAGFGFVARTDPSSERLTATFPDAAAFVAHDLADDLALLRGELPDPVAEGIRRAVQTWQIPLRHPLGRLAHGDFDGSHIFADETGYTGIIDFGEMRGADPLYDLAHFATIGTIGLSDDLLAPLLDGYCAVEPLDEGDVRRMWLWAALIGVRFLARTRGRSAPPERARLVARVADALRQQAG